MEIQPTACAEYCYRLRTPNRIGGMKALLFSPQISERQAYEYLEGRLWGGRPVCPRCSASRSSAVRSSACRVGVHKCLSCRKPFSVKAGTMFENTHVALPAWFDALALVYSSATPLTVRSLKSAIGVSHVTAHLMLRKINEVKGKGWASRQNDGCIGDAQAALEIAVADIAFRRRTWFAGG